MRKLQKNETVDLNNQINLTLTDAKARYRIGSTTLRKIAEECGALISVGRRILFHRPTLDKYFQENKNI